MKNIEIDFCQQTFISIPSIIVRALSSTMGSTVRIPWLTFFWIKLRIVKNSEYYYGIVMSIVAIKIVNFIQEIVNITIFSESVVSVVRSIRDFVSLLVEKFI